MRKVVLDRAREDGRDAYLRDRPPLGPAGQRPDYLYHWMRGHEKARRDYPPTTTTPKES